MILLFCPKNLIFEFEGNNDGRWSTVEGNIGRFRKGPLAKEDSLSTFSARSSESFKVDWSAILMQLYKADRLKMGKNTSRVGTN